MTEATGDESSLMMSTFASALPHVRQERLRAYVVTTRTRAGPLPDVPTLEEEGLKDYEYASWYGLFAPTRTSKGIIDKVHKAAAVTLQSPGVLKIYEAQGLNATPTTPEQFARYVASERRKWAGIVSHANIALQ